jgi:hypothetical protein
MKKLFKNPFLILGGVIAAIYFFNRNQKQTVNGFIDVDKQTDEIEKILNKNNIKKKNYLIKKSKTNFGNSNYIELFDNDFKEILKIRISDHSTGQSRVFNEIPYKVFILNEDNYIKIIKSYL